jgi:hypothetical protein
MNADFDLGSSAFIGGHYQLPEPQIPLWAVARVRNSNKEAFCRRLA